MNEHGLEFTEIEDSVVVLVSGGVYRQGKAYLRGGFVYAKYGSGFVQILRTGTSKPNLRIDGLNLGKIKSDFNKLGRMVPLNIEDADIKIIEHKAA